MSEAAIFRATYADWRLVKTRGVVQIILEVPLSDADRAYQVVGGMPDAARERWFAVARLSSAAEQKPAQLPKPEKGDKRLVQQAAICCTDPVFWKFLQEHMGLRNLKIANETAAATAVRDLCRVTSRSEIVLGTPAAEKWDEIYSRFTAWKVAA